MHALTFQVGPDRVALDVRLVREVVPRVRLAPSPGGPPGVAGVFVYRGRVVPVYDLHRLTGAGECPPHLSSRIILIPHPPGTDRLVGLLATQVDVVRDVPDDGATELTATSHLGPAVADGSGILRVLDPGRLIAVAEAAFTPLLGAIR